MQVPNDTARLGFGVSKIRATQGAALRAAAKALRKVIGAVQGFSGVGPGDLVTGRISVRKISRRGTPGRYRAGQGIEVTLHQPESSGELTSVAIAAGASGVRGPEFFVGDTELAFKMALEAAFTKARGRAEVLAKAAGATFGPALQIAVKALAVTPNLHGGLRNEAWGRVSEGNLNGFALAGVSCGGDRA